MSVWHCFPWASPISYGVPDISTTAKRVAASMSFVSRSAVAAFVRGMSVARGPRCVKPK